MPKPRYNQVSPKDIGRTIVTTLTQYMADLTSKSKVLNTEASVPIHKNTPYSCMDVFISASNPFTFDSVKGILSLSSTDSFIVLIVDADTAESVYINVDKLMVFHGVSNNVFTLQTNNDSLIKVSIIRAG